MSIITLTTDFGTRDHYAGAIKGAIFSINPKAAVVDITHEIPSFDIGAAAYVLACAYSFYPAGTIHVAVVDPGVGSARKGIVLKTPNYFFVGPDNGIFSLVARREKIEAIHQLENRSYFRKEISDTFHARDIFCPVAAHLSLRVEPNLLGPAVDRLERLEEDTFRIEKDRIEGTVIYIDHFGNGITNIESASFDGKVGRRRFQFSVGGRRITAIARNYDEMPAGRPTLVRGSSGFIEVAMNRGSVAKKWKLKTGQKVNLQI
ncbi:MAG: SAM-dependent chlorinase/fluorinase [Deltaproteobacteria bacterium]|nr:SAM-dependent chlorinase/fluorinase [Deltaproteobacteria bacterium]